MAEYFPRVLLSLNTDGIFYWSLLLPDVKDRDLEIEKGQAGLP